jgi:hypothetical protein
MQLRKVIRHLKSSGHETRAQRSREETAVDFDHGLQSSLTGRQIAWTKVHTTDVSTRFCVTGVRNGASVFFAYSRYFPALKETER